MNEQQTHKRKRIVYCPACQHDMLNLWELIDHAKISNCGMTLERLQNVGVLDAGEVEEIKSQRALETSKSVSR